MVSVALPADVTRLIGEIADRFRPTRIVLFGSHATGRAVTGSDVDLLVVMDGTLRPLQQAAAISRALDHQVPVDILVRTPAQVASPDPRDLILRSVLRDGVVVYETGD
jgi:predicted nucleotidyltransferase